MRTDQLTVPAVLRRYKGPSLTLITLHQYCCRRSCGTDCMPSSAQHRTNRYRLSLIFDFENAATRREYHVCSFWTRSNLKGAALKQSINTLYFGVMAFLMSIPGRSPSSLQYVIGGHPFISGSIAMYSLGLVLCSSALAKCGNLEFFPLWGVYLFSAAHSWPIFALRAAGYWWTCTSVLLTPTRTCIGSCDGLISADGLYSPLNSAFESSSHSDLSASGAQVSTEVVWQSWNHENAAFMGHTLLCFPAICLTAGIPFVVLLLPMLCCCPLLAISATCHSSTDPSAVFHGLTPILLTWVVWSQARGRANRWRSERLDAEAAEAFSHQYKIQKELERKLATQRTTNIAQMAHDIGTPLSVLILAARETNLSKHCLHKLNAQKVGTIQFVYKHKKHKLSCSHFFCCVLVSLK